MSEHRKNREQLKRRVVERFIRNGVSVSKAAKLAGVSYAYAKMVYEQMGQV